MESDEPTLNNHQEVTSVDQPIDETVEAPVHAYPETRHADFQPLDPNYISAERVSGLILFGVVFAGVLVGLAFKFFAGGADWIFFLLAGLAAALLLLLLWSAVYWPPISYRHINWRLDESGLEIHRGVWWKNRIAVPLARVQHADVSQGPLQRSYGIGTLTLHTAGTSNASVELAGLNHQLALELRDRLIRN